MSNKNNTVDKCCQDFQVITFNTKTDTKTQEKTKEVQKNISQKIVNPEDVKIEADKKLGKILSQSRITKGYNSQKEFASKLGISSSIYTKWENNSEVPTNEQIAKMEKILGIRLPRNKKIKKTEE